MTEILTEKQVLKARLLAFGEFTPAPGCLKACHWLSPLFRFKVVTTREALRLCVQRLVDDE